MSDISLCPHCNAYIDTARNSETCNVCGKSLVSSGAGVGASGQNRSEAPPADSSERDHIRCPTCNDLVSTRYTPVTCYKCGPIKVDEKSLPPVNSEFVTVPNYLIPNVILCFVGCLLPAIIGVVYSLLALSAKRKEDYAAANAYANTAKNWMTAGIVLSALAWLGWLGNHMR